MLFVEKKKHFEIVMVEDDLALGNRLDNYWLVVLAPLLLVQLKIVLKFIEGKLDDEQNSYHKAVPLVDKSELVMVMVEDNSSDDALIRL